MSAPLVTQKKSLIRLTTVVNFMTFFLLLTLQVNKLECLSIVKPLQPILIGLHHPLDGKTSPEYKLLYFTQLTKFFCKEKNAAKRRMH